MKRKFLLFGLVITTLGFIFTSCDKVVNYTSNQNNYVETNRQIKNLYMEDDALYQAKVNNNDTVMVYCAESTLQLMLSLSHAITYHRANPTGDIIFLAAKNSNLIDDNSFFNAPNVHLFRSSDKVKPFTPDNYNNVATALNGRPYKLYIIDREFWADWIDNHLYLFANAHSVNILEEGSGSYMPYFQPNLIYTRVPDYKNNINEIESILNNIRKEYPFVAGSDNFEKATSNYTNNLIENMRLLATICDISGLEHIDPLTQLYPWFLAQTSKCATWWQHPQALKNISLYYEPGKIDVRAFFNAFCSEDKKLFTSILKYDYDAMNTKYWDKSSKPNLVLIGTHFGDDSSNPDPNILGNKNMMNWLRWAINEYGNEYDVFFKPHPRYTTGHAKMFADAGISGYTMIDDSFPFEMIELTGAGNKYCSTFSSSLYFIQDRNKLIHVIDLTGNTINYNSALWKTFKRMGVVTDSMYITSEQLN